MMKTATRRVIWSTTRALLIAGVILLLGPISSAAPDEDASALQARRAERKEAETAAHEKALEELPDGWRSKEMGRLLVLNHADRMFAARIAAHANAIWTWLDKHFGYVGEGEYVRRPILRICKNTGEEGFYRTRANDLGSLEIVTHHDKRDGARSYEFKYVTDRLYWHWIRERNLALCLAQPDWLQLGLLSLLWNARVKGSRLQISYVGLEQEILRQLALENDLPAPRELVMLEGEEFGDNAAWNMHASAMFVRFLLEAKSKKTRRVLHDYFRNLQDFVAERDARERKQREERRKSGAKKKRPMTEKEEARRETELLREVFDRTFGDWTDKDWKRFKALYFKSAG